MSAASMSAQEYDGDGRSRLLSQLKPQMSLLDERRLSKTFTVRDITNVMPRPFVFEGYCHDTNSRDFRETPANASCNICDWPQILGALAMIWSMLAVQFTPTRCVPRGSSKSRVRILHRKSVTVSPREVSPATGFWLCFSTLRLERRGCRPTNCLLVIVVALLQYLSSQ